MLEKLWMGLEVTSVWENTSVGCQPPLVACRCRRESQGDWERIEMWWCRETWVPLKMLNLSLVIDIFFKYQLVLCIRMDEIT